MTVTLGNDKEKEVMEMTPAGFINEVTNIVQSCAKILSQYSI